MRRAVILAGGEGTRLRPYTTVLPKPLMPIGDRPVLDIVVRQLKAPRLRADHDRHRLPGGADRGLLPRRRGLRRSRSTTSASASRSAPSGALALIEGLAEDDVLVMNGDVLTDIDYGGAARSPPRERQRRDDRDQAAPGPDLARRAALRRRGRPDAPDRLRREAHDRLHREHGRLLLRSARARPHRAGRAPGLPRPDPAADRRRRGRARLAERRLLAGHRAPRRLRAGPGGVRVGARPADPAEA